MDLIKFLEIAAKLKDVERTGWLESGVKDPETSSDHSFMTALMVLVLGRKASLNAFNRSGRGRKLNMEKALKMALIHDLPEAIVGDIITKEKENWERPGHLLNADKVKKERHAIKSLCPLIGDYEIPELWEEFEAQKTPESRFVKDAEMAATIFQAVQYRREGNFKKPMDGFWSERKLSMIRDPEIRKFVGSVLSTLGRKKDG
jgi:putative hydrolase of HD superfamily